MSKETVVGMTRAEIIDLLNKWYEEGKIRAKRDYDPEVMHTTKKRIGSAINKHEIWQSPSSTIISTYDIREEFSALFETKRICDYDDVIASLDKQTYHELRNRCMRGEFTLFDKMGSNAKLYVK